MKKFNVQYAKTPMKVGEKTHWPIIGRAFLEASGRITVCLDSLPFEKYWDGRIILYPIDSEDSKV